MSDTKLIGTAPQVGGFTATGGQGTVTLNSREVAKEFADLKLATETRPPNFTGGAGDPVDVWLKKFNRIAKALDWDDKRKLVQVPIYLSSFGGNWWDKETEEGTKTPWASWKNFEDALIKRFRPKDLIMRYKAEMRRRRQKVDEDISDYFNDKMSKCYLVNPKMDDDDVIQQLKEGLLDTFYTQVVLSKAKTPVDFYEDLVLAQTALKRDKKNIPATGPVKGHPAEKYPGSGRKFDFNRGNARKWQENPDSSKKAQEPGAASGKPPKKGVGISLENPRPKAKLAVETVGNQGILQEIARKLTRAI